MVREGILVLCWFLREYFQLLVIQYDMGYGFIIYGSYYFEVCSFFFFFKLRWSFALVTQARVQWHDLSLL